MNHEVPEVYREVFDLRDEVRHLRDQVRNDDEYLAILESAEDMPAEWKERIAARRMWMRKDWPKLFSERGND